ncbi:ATP-binding cassette domain-containing protein [Chitinolyticbacter meiyuanensis]|uniref:ATP-binding cassette domain-containing protein n=1 Tax=Chitinolyticbacter meiyuanensis TaxID=682798 RepID=UPI0011E5D7C4|nr:ATP-binding cassette domain-containing protein [Chitinolyticbacter meiyuanensis]
MSPPLFAVAELGCDFTLPGGLPWQRRHITALDAVTLSIAAGEALGVVGESGSGKSTLARIATGLLPPSRGTRSWLGAAMPPGPHPGIQMVFQDAGSALNPRLRIGRQIAEAPLLHGLIAGRPDDFVAGALERVGLAAALANRYPHQLSGGQRARVGIARALALRPQLLVCDEATAALDVVVQAQVLNLLHSLRRELGLALLFISHDLAVVRHVCERVAVMQAGRVVEVAHADTLFCTPAHPYTHALLSAVPTLSSFG